MSCVTCCNETLVEISPDYNSVGRVTSDARPHLSASRILVCDHCGLVQKPYDQALALEVDEIYSSYNMYDGELFADQLIWSSSGASMDRSQWVLKHVSESIELPLGSLALDVGCGNGAFLRAAGNYFEGVTLFGSEFGASNEDAFRDRIKGFSRLLVKNEVFSSGMSFDLVTLIHSLEHIPEPGAYLRRLAAILSERGSIVVVVPNVLTSPFDIYISDHVSHFSPSSLRRLLISAGLEVLAVDTDTLPKEMIFTCARSTSDVGSGGPADRVDVAEVTGSLRARILSHRNHLEALNQLTSSGQSIGVYGSSVASAWVTSNLTYPPSYYIDDAPAKIGGEFLGRPVLAFEQVPHGAIVVMPFGPETVSAKSLERPDIKTIPVN